MESTQYHRRVVLWQLRASVAVVAGALCAWRGSNTDPLASLVASPIYSLTNVYFLVAYAGAFFMCVTVMAIGLCQRWMWTRWLTLVAEFAAGGWIYEVFRETEAVSPTLGLHVMIATVTVFAIVAWAGHRKHPGTRALLNYALGAACMWLANIAFLAWWTRDMHTWTTWWEYPFTVLYIGVLLESIYKNAGRWQSRVGDELDAAYHAWYIVLDFWLLYSELARLVRMASKAKDGDAMPATRPHAS